MSFLSNDININIIRKNTIGKDCQIMSQHIPMRL